MNGKIMSETMPDQEIASKKDLAFIDVLHNRAVILKALEAGTLPCFPGKDGFADTIPAVNIVNGDFYNGLTLLLLKEHQRVNNFPTAEYVTLSQVECAQKDNPGVSVIKGEKGVSVNAGEKNFKTATWKYKNITLFNAAQVSNSDMINNFPELHLIQNKPGMGIACSSFSPEEYLGDYFTAISMNLKFCACKEQGLEFAKQMKEKLLEKNLIINTKDDTTISVPNPFTLSKITDSAIKNIKHNVKVLSSPDPEDKYYKSLEKQLKKEQKQNHKKKHTQKHSLSRC